MGYFSLWKRHAKRHFPPFFSYCKICQFLLNLHATSHLQVLGRAQGPGQRPPQHGPGHRDLEAGQRVAGRQRMRVEGEGVHQGAPAAAALVGGRPSVQGNANKLEMGEMLFVLSYQRVYQMCSEERLA